MEKEIILAVGASLLIAQAAAAQTTTAPAAPAATETNLGEVVVTAQRRSERLVEVPMSVSAVTGAQLGAAGVSTTQDLTLVTPGLVLARSSSYAQPTIRGIGSRNSGPGDEPNVSIFVDGVYQPEQSANFFDLANIERVEVLKGPQGTLFGRNATGGAINIITKTPSATVEGEGSVTYGRYDYWKGTAFVSGPLTQDGKAMASVSAVALRDSGYEHNVFLNTTQGKRSAFSTRAKLRFLPTDNIELQLNGLYFYNSDNSAFSGHALNGSTTGRRLAVGSTIPTNIAFPTGTYDTATQIIPVSNAHTSMIDAHANIDLGWASLSALASLEHTRNHAVSDLDVSPYPVLINDQTLKGRSANQELYLTSTPGRFTWLTGVSLFEGTSMFNPQVLSGATRVYGQRTRAFSAFAEGTYEVLPHLFLTGGLRYSKDKLKSSLATAPAAPIHGKADFDDLSPRAVVRYEFNPRANVYASFTKGYKSGVFNSGSTFGALNPAAPEKVKAFEVGAKAEVGSDWNFSAAAFHYKYTNLQTTIVVTLNGVLTGILENAPAAKVDGAEFTAAYAPNRHFDASAGLSLLRPKVTNFPNASVNVPVFFNGLPAGNAALSRDVSGNDLIRAPRESFNLAANYRLDLAGGELAFSANALFSAKYYVELGNRVVQPAYNMVNGSVTYTFADRHTSVSVFGQNLTNETYFLANTISTISDTVSYSKPRWFGVTVDYKY